MDDFEIDEGDLQDRTARSQRRFQAPASLSISAEVSYFTDGHLPETLIELFGDRRFFDCYAAFVEESLSTEDGVTVNSVDVVEDVPTPEVGDERVGVGLDIDLEGHGEHFVSGARLYTVRVGRALVYVGLGGFKDSIDDSDVVNDALEAMVDRLEDT